MTQTHRVSFGPYERVVRWILALIGSSYGPYDMLIRLISALVGAYLVAAYGGNESFFELLWTPGFYIEYAATLLITILIIQLIYLVTVRLDRHYNWIKHPWIRLLLQFFFGVIVPSIITFLLAAIYFAIYGMNILKANYQHYPLPYIIALIVIFNLYYLISYLLAENIRLRRLANNNEAIKFQGNSLAMQSAAYGVSEPSSNVKTKGTFIVRTLTANFPIAVEEIAYFYRSNDNVYMRCFSGNKHLLSQSLDAVFSQLDSRQFFRVARHMIVNYNAIKGYQTLKDGKLDLILPPEFQTEVTVSKPLARTFKKWMDR